MVLVNAHKVFMEKTAENRLHKYYRKPKIVYKSLNNN